MRANRPVGRLRRIGRRTPGRTAAAGLAARRLEAAARACRAALAEGGAASLRAALRQAFDAIDLVQAGPARAHPPADPGQTE
jgi:hypothetical protein